MKNNFMRYAGIVIFAGPLALSLYFFFQLAFYFWMSDLFAALAAASVTYFTTDKLIRSKRSSPYKIFLAITIVVSVYAAVSSFIGITNQLRSLDAAFNYSLNN